MYGGTVGVEDAEMKKEDGEVTRIDAKLFQTNG